MDHFFFPVEVAALCHCDAAVAAAAGVLHDVLKTERFPWPPEFRASARAEAGAAEANSWTHVYVFMNRPPY